MSRASEKAVTALKAFVLAKQCEEYPSAEIRAYAEENAAELAPAWGLEPQEWVEKLSSVHDVDLARKLLKSIKTAQASAHDANKEGRLKAAQSAADAIGAAAVWNGDTVDIDLGALLEGALSAKGDTLVIEEEGMHGLVVPMAPLYRLRTETSKAWRRGAWAYVGGGRLHVRWGAKGGLKLGLPGLIADKPKGNVVTIHVAARQSAAA